MGGDISIGVQQRPKKKKKKVLRRLKHTPTGVSRGPDGFRRPFLKAVGYDSRLCSPQASSGGLPGFRRSLRCPKEPWATPGPVPPNPSPGMGMDSPAMVQLYVYSDLLCQVAVDGADPGNPAPWRRVARVTGS